MGAATGAAVGADVAGAAVGATVDVDVVGARGTVGLMVGALDGFLDRSLLFGALDNFACLGAFGDLPSLYTADFLLLFFIFGALVFVGIFGDFTDFRYCTCGSITDTVSTRSPVAHARVYNATTTTRAR